MWRRDNDYIGKRLLRMEVPGKRRKGRPKRRYMDVLREDLKTVRGTLTDAAHRSIWRRCIHCGNPD